jgi:hypothetical protein
MESVASPTQTESLESRIGIDGVFLDAPMAMALVSLTHRRIVNLNPAASTLFGRSRARARRLPFERLFAPQARERLIAVFDALQHADRVPWLDESASVDLPSARRGAGGAPQALVVELHFLIVRSPPGEARYALVLAHNVTGGRRLERARGDKAYVDDASFQQAARGAVLMSQLETAVRCLHAIARSRMMPAHARGQIRKAARAAAAADAALRLLRRSDVSERLAADLGGEPYWP